jgi:simple sugar transport system substrate-binding protein
VPKDAQDKVLKLEAEMKAGKPLPFSGPLKSNEGKDIVAMGAGLTDAEIGGMNYYVMGVTGKVPK